MPTLAELVAGLNRGFVTGTLGAPVDLMNTLLAGAGGQQPVMGSQWIGDKLQGMGLLSQDPGTGASSLAEVAGGLLSPGAPVKGAALAGGLLSAGRLGKMAEMEKPTLAALREKWTKAGVDNYVSDGKDALVLNKVEVPKEMRGQGVGTNFMQELTALADAQGKRVDLSPSTDFGGSSVARLKEFYKRFGFVENKGANKDYAISESMYRPPRSAP